MLKIAKSFFDVQVAEVSSMEDFFQSDLCKFFELMYKKKLVVADSGFIKVVKKHNIFYLYENVFRDIGEPASFYISLEGVEFKKGVIEYSNIGAKLSKEGYALVNNTPEYIETLKKLPLLPFSAAGCERVTEPSRTLKFNPLAWGEPNHQTEVSKEVYDNVQKELRRRVSFSPILHSLDAFDSIALEWTKGRSILPHNDIDFRMFINIKSST